MDGRDGGGAKTVEGQAGKPKLIAPLEDEHDFIASFYSEVLKIGGGGLRFFFEFEVAEGMVFSFIVDPYQGGFLGFQAGIFVHHVVGKVEVVGYFYFKVLLKVFQRVEVILNQVVFIKLHEWVLKDDG